jgi:GntR family transcriptional regulator
MRFWLSRNSEVPLREQLATQVLLGILSKDLKPGEKLPSTRELGRRLKLHPNTVSATYRELERRGWLDFRKGSGVYVPLKDTAPLIDTKLQVDRMISDFLQLVREKGIPLREVQTRLRQWLELQPPDHFLLLEPDDELRNILATEIAEATGFPTVGARLAECERARLFTGAAPVFLFNKAERMRALLPPQMFYLTLRTSSIPAALQSKLPIAPDTLIAVVSRWPDFRIWARTVLVAAGVNHDAVICLDAKEKSFRCRLVKNIPVITDLPTAHFIPADNRVYVFRLVSESSMTELRSFVRSLPGRHPAD